jgi:hypothetical protein
VPEDLADRWFAAFDAALDRGDFLGVLTIWVVSGVKPVFRASPNIAAQPVDADRHRR